MESVLKRLKTKKTEIKEKENDEKNKNLFIKIEEINNRKIYHTKIMTDFYKFGINKKKNRFFILLRKLFNRENVEFFSLFSIIENDKFLGIFYGYKKPIKNVVTRYEENGVMKASTFSKVYYIEFRFKKGSIFCYIVGISYLIRKEKVDTKYCKSLIKTLLNLEKQVYEFYNKKLPYEGIITRWIEKNQK
ncbi:DUF226 domain-containing protein [Borrelia miyamotoi]|uniref:DUF226 domain-containing protein n=1 Tax=Borrelia miyamotoi TaxID=47466 RepID=A0A481YEJ8_9SPIR|nr:DUF226 domain-containing protein [Borrelia miyamotoi]QBK62673.1 DUF226 domain-containing protein [Borrelia miyamotoi]QBK63898.1 DUF226 domain-containing protein [Borrelia miyamotoi]QDA32764.1 DUF226 domain-containing protein [Borrelia miyamotoi]WCL22347.1 DUF226 domain-containing protein [Borrelia miyamotoi]WDE70538.1 DUF226 domain-containing protein [Borrelia miyamotoi]